LKIDQVDINYPDSVKINYKNQSLYNLSNFNISYWITYTYSNKNIEYGFGLEFNKNGKMISENKFPDFSKNENADMLTDICAALSIVKGDKRFSKKEVDIVELAYLDDANSFCWLIKEELNRAPNLHLGGQLLAGRGQRRRFAAGQDAGPLLPAFPVVAFPQRIEENKIFQPPFVRTTKTLKASASVASGLLKKIPRRCDDQGQLALKYFLVVDCSGPVRQTSQLRRFHPATLSQSLQADQQGIAGKCRSRRVRRIPSGRGPEGQHLPQALARRRQKIGELVGGRPKIANTAARRKRCRV